MRVETTISQPPRGGGRSLDLTYPDNVSRIPGTVGMGTSWINRQAYSAVAIGTETGFGVPPAGTGWTTYRGRVCYKQMGQNLPGAGGFFSTGGGNFAIYFPTLRQGASVYSEDFRCWRVTLICAIDTITATGGCGLEVGPNNALDIRTGAAVGFALGPSQVAQNRANLLIKQTGVGITVNQEIAIGDSFDYNMYEMRFIGATATKDGIFKAFINGTQVFSGNWGAGTQFCNLIEAGAGGFRVSTGNRNQNGATYTAQCGLTISAGPTEASLL